MSDLYNPKNERIKYRYRMFLSNAKQRDSKTVISVLKHLHVYEKFRDFSDFTQVSETIIHNYVNKLLNTDRSLSYCDHNLRALRDFYTWLERQKGYKSKIN